MVLYHCGCIAVVSVQYTRLALEFVCGPSLYAVDWLQLYKQPWLSSFWRVLISCLIWWLWTGVFPAGCFFHHLALTFPVYSDQCKRRIPLLTVPVLVHHVCGFITGSQSWSFNFRGNINLCQNRGCKVEQNSFYQPVIIYSLEEDSSCGVWFIQKCVMPYLCVSFRCYVM